MMRIKAIEPSKPSQDQSKPRSQQDNPWLKETQNLLGCREWSKLILHAWMKLSQTCKKTASQGRRIQKLSVWGNCWKFIWGVQVLEQWVAASLPHPNLLWPSCSMLAPVAAKGNRKHAKMRATSPAASKALVTKVPSKCKKGGNSKVEKGQPHGKTIHLNYLCNFQYRRSSANATFRFVCKKAFNCFSQFTSLYTQLMLRMSD